MINEALIDFEVVTYFLTVDWAPAQSDSPVWSISTATGVF